MSKKLVLALFLVALVSVVVGLTAFAKPDGKGVEINQEIVGSIFGGIEVASDGETVQRSLLDLYAKGGPGEANIEGVGTDLELVFVGGGFVETFNDLSMLFYVIDTSPDAENALCVDFQGAPTTGVFDYVITGGAGRFEGATGSATVKVTSWGVTDDLSAETGTIEGTIQLP
jgi:hypothetical protein